MPGEGQTKLQEREKSLELQERGLEVSKAIAERRALVQWGDDGVQLANLDQALTFAQCLIESGAAPKGATAGGIVASVQHGAELRTPARPQGLGPMQSIQLIPSINGRPFVMGDLAKALVLESDVLEPGTQIEEWLEGEEKTDTWVAHCRSCRKGDPKPVEHTFSWTEAKRAGLTGKSGPWKDYPQRQMRYRALGFHLRDQYGGLLLGLHTYEEGKDMPVIREVAPPTEADPLFVELKSDQPKSADTTEPIIDAEFSLAVDDFEGLGDPSKNCETQGCELGAGHTSQCEISLQK